MVPLTYVRAIARAGGAAAAARPDARRPRRPAPSCSTCSTACSITGGADVDPADLRRRAAPRDRADRRPTATPSSSLLVRAAAERDLPAWASAAACRWSTSPTAARSTSTSRTGSRTTSTAAQRHFADHRVEVEPDSLAALAAGATRVAVKSYHHQGVARLGDGLRVTARAQATAPSRPSRTPTAASCSACCGIPRRTRPTA